MTETEAPTLGGGCQRTDPRSLHESMAAAASRIGAVAKNLRNADSHYNARSIDDILDAVHGPLCEAGIVLTFDTLERETSTRGKMNYVALRVAYTFHGEDGQSLTTTVWGEATDAADKAGNKALSAALKMALIQTFTIPVNGDQGDADSSTNAGTPDEPPPPVPDDWTDAILSRLAQIRGDRSAYPKEWIAAELPSVETIGKAGLTERQHSTARDVLEAIEARLAGSEGGREAVTEPSDPESPCGVCGADIDAGEPHSSDCEAREL